MNARRPENSGRTRTAAWQGGKEKNPSGQDDATPTGQRARGRSPSAADAPDRADKVFRQQRPNEIEYPRLKSPHDSPATNGDRQC
ncbi:hypothetical protein GCM10027562_24380 [Arthrobacter pigmenti]